MNLDRYNSLFFDIETTGLSSELSALTVIGCCSPDETVTQWFNEDGLSQKEILLSFFDFIKDYDTLISFNGKTFDLPFLDAKAKQFHLPNPLKSMKHIDLYYLLKPYRNLFPTKRFRQKDLEDFISFRRLDRLSGKAVIKTYQNWIQSKNSALKDQILLHNKEDVLGLSALSSLLCYPALHNGNFSVVSVKNDDAFHAELLLDQPFPTPLYLQSDCMELHVTGSFAQFICFFADGFLKHYLPNPKDYYYLPEEDIIIPKSMGSFVDSSCRIPADASRCYSKFRPGNDFFNNSEQLLTFCQHNILYLLSSRP